MQFCPTWGYFKPEGTPRAGMEVVELTREEIEALRLRNIKGFNQTEAAGKMAISQSTYQRILTSANKKVTEALIKGKTIKLINKNHL